jgi:toxin-antitoxin system PIN domain toxin
MNGMLLIDVNVIIYAARKDAKDHALYRAWFDRLLASGEPFRLPEIVAVAFVRIATNPRAFAIPHSMIEALAVIDDLRSRQSCIWTRATDRHWLVFSDLCLTANIKGPDCTDSWLAALALDNNCELISCDRGFTRFPTLRWRHPLDP